MNILKGKIIDIQTYNSLSYVEIEIRNHLTMVTVVLDVPNESSYLVVNKEVEVYFKESEVIISKSIDIQISVHNKIPCIVQSIQKGVILSEIILSCFDFEIKSIITTKLVEKIQLQENDEVLALINNNEISLSSPHD